VWMAENQELIAADPLRGTREGSRNALTARNGHHPGETPERERNRATGISCGCLALAGGPQRQ
jgi:hypothetical protein